MTSTPKKQKAAFSRIKIRTEAIIFCGDDVALIRRDRPTPPTTPRRAATSRMAKTSSPPCAGSSRRNSTWTSTRPTAVTCCGSSISGSPARAPPPPRKLHLIYRLQIAPELRASLAEQELDELPDGSHEVGVIEWIDYRKTAELLIFPPIGAHLNGPPT